MIRSPSTPDGRLGAVVGLATVVGLILRAWPPGRLGLNQFDEGIYALAAGWARHPSGIAAISPGLIPYAPPGYPLAVGVAAWFVGGADQAAFLVSAICGAATIPAVALVARRLVGAPAAAVAAWCACLSGPHIAFSRMALTDATFLCAWTIGLLAGREFLAAPRLATGFLMGLMVGVAQECKYNGWLLGALVILTAGVDLATAPRSRSRGEWVRLGCWGGAGALVAAAVVAPWFWFVERHGGYAGLLAHQGSYLGGWAAWWPNLQAQGRQAVALAGPPGLGWCNAIAAAAACWWVGRVGAEAPPGRGWVGLALGAAAVGVLAASPVVAGLIALPGLCLACRGANRLLVVGWAVLGVLSPFYHPYARLWLPFEMLHWVVLGSLAARLVALPIAQPRFRGMGRGDGWVLGATGLAVAAALVAGPGFPPGRAGGVGSRLFEPSDSLRFAADEVAAAVPPGMRGLRTLVRPSMAYYLGGRVATMPVDGLEAFARGGEAGTWGLVDSALLPAGAELPGSLRGRWEVARAIRAWTTLPTQLDLDPTHPGEDPALEFATFWLIRPRTLDP